MKTDELKKLVEAATPGPWKFTASENSDKGFDDLSIFAGGATVINGCGCCGSPFGDKIADVHLVTAAPALAREVIALREAAVELANLADKAHSMTNAAFGAGTEEREGGSARRQGQLSDKYWAWHHEMDTALATLRAVLGESK
jgi:hypothetical protein